MNKKRKQLLDDMFGALSIMSGGNYVALYDIKDRMTRFSPGAAELFGLPGEYVPDGADEWTEHIHPEDRHVYQRAMSELISCRRLTYDLTYRAVKKDGSCGLFRFKGAVVRDDNGAPSLVGGIMINEGALDNTDPVTVLRNRNGFMNDLGAIRKLGQSCRVLLIGIDRLAELNESRGYDYGNRLLRAVGWTMRDICGRDGYIYRMDGSKFAFLTKTLSSSETVGIYSRIRRRLRDGVDIDGVRQSLNPCGASMSVSASEMTDSAVYSCLLYACSESKLKKHGNLVVFDGISSDGIDNMKIISAIHNDIIGNFEGFYLEYQPIFRLKSGRLKGVETLLRWRSEEYGEILPDRFMHIIEHDYALSELTMWITRHAMLDGLRFFEKNDDMVLGINMAAAQIEDDYFIPELMDTAQRTGFPLNRLIIELSRNCRLLDPAIVKARTSELRQNGIKFLLDDFGSGFSSIGVLKALNADYIKFDLSFVSDIENSGNDRSDLEKLSELCAARGCDVCVKGIENENMHKIIRQLPITSVQGFHYSRPIDAEAMLELLDRLQKISKETKNE
ncbi:MAG: EAL domain-containing protein [Ruminiclostridium sp.]|nr:EAL domain-containing protein [Ruminiclostridium sp.]